MAEDIMDQFSYRTVPLALMERLQSIAKQQAAEFLLTYRDKNGLAASI